MADVTVLIFHLPAAEGESELVRVLANVRGELAARHADLFRTVGASKVRFVSEWRAGIAFGEVLASMVPARGGLIVLSGGAVPLLNRRDAAQLVEFAAARERVALTNNRYSSDVCAVADAASLRALPPLPSDNALPRWLEERAGYSVAELGSRERLGLDIDTPLDIALAALSPVAPGWLLRAAREAQLSVPRLEELRELALNPRAEMLVFGRAGSSTLRWLEQHVRCRVRFLAEERGLRASSPLAIGATVDVAETIRVPQATLGLLLDEGGPEALADVVAGLADGAVLDSRVLLAHRLGGDESGWPAPADRFASDLHRPHGIADPWLHALTSSAVGSGQPILLGGHTLVGPAIPLLLRNQNTLGAGVE